VVRVVVSDQNGVDVVRCLPEARKRRGESSPMSGQARVQHRQPAALLEQVPVLIATGQSMDAARDLRET
jgi:hypothetical protein